MAARLGANPPRSRFRLHLRRARAGPHRSLNWHRLPHWQAWPAVAAGLILAAAPVLAGERVATGEQVSAKGSAIARAPAEARPSAAQSVAQSVAYIEAAILAPADDAALRDNAGHVQVHGRVRPALAPGHQVQLLLDGTPWGSPQSTADFSLANIDRGTHSLALRILNGAGKPLFTGQPSTFHLLRHSRLHPKPNSR